MANYKEGDLLIKDYSVFIVSEVNTYPIKIYRLKSMSDEQSYQDYTPDQVDELFKKLITQQELNKFMKDFKRGIYLIGKAFDSALKKQKKGGE